MRKQKFLKALLVTSVITAIAIVACLGLVACNKHEHTLSDWTYTDGTGHYKTCTGDNCTEPIGTKIESGSHDTKGTDGACSVCGYKATVNPPAHVCGHVCETCGKCTDTTCTDPVCVNNRCPGHTPTPAHVCGHVCETCGKCTDTTCNDPACAEKCQGHDEPTPEHVCAHVCPVEGCGKCLDANCNDPACAEKCPGHAPAHICEHICPVEGCGKCTDTTCNDPACAEKCPGHKTVFEQLRDADNNVIAEDFATGYEADQKLAEFGGIYGVKGLYSSDRYDDNHYVKITNGAAEQVGSSANLSMIVDLGIVTGKVEGYVELTATDMGSKWAMFQIMGTSTAKKDSEVFSITTAGSASAGFTFTYRIDGADVSNAILANTIAAAKNTLYKVYFILENGKITVTINGTALVSDLEVAINEVCGLKFIASNSGKRLLTIDNIAVTGTAAELAAYKTKFNGKVNSLKTTYSATCTQNINAVNAAYDKATAAIDAATEVSVMLAAYNTCDAEMKAIDTDEQIAAARALAEAKEAALAALNGHKGGADNFTTEGEEGNKTAYEAAITAGRNAINAATTPEEVTAALNAAKEVIDGIWTDDQLVATKYKVTFVNSPVEEQEVAENDNVAKPDDPTDADAVFVNWYSDAACTEVFDFNTAITADTKIYAKWEGKLVQGTGSNKYGSDNFTAIPDSGETSDATTSDAYITWYINGTSELANAGITGYTKAIKLKGGTQNGSTVRYIKIHLEKAGTIKVVFHLTSDDANGRWMSIDRELKGKTSTPSADKSATATTKNVATTIECELEAGDWYLNCKDQLALCEVTITINSTSTTWFTGITGTPTTTTYEAVPTAADVDLAGLALAVKDSEDTVALTADSVKAKVSVVVNVPEEEGGAYSITVKYGNYVTYTYDVTVTAQTETEQPTEPGETEEPTEPGETNAD